MSILITQSRRKRMRIRTRDMEERNLEKGKKDKDDKDTGKENNESHLPLRALHKDHVVVCFFEFFPELLLFPACAVGG